MVNVIHITGGVPGGQRGDNIPRLPTQPLDVTWATSWLVKNEKECKKARESNDGGCWNENRLNETYETT